MQPLLLDNVGGHILQLLDKLGVQRLLTAEHHGCRSQRERQRAAAVAGNLGQDVVAISLDLGRTVVLEQDGIGIRIGHGERVHLTIVHILFPVPGSAGQLRINCGRGRRLRGWFFGRLSRRLSRLRWRLGWLDDLGL